MLCDLYEECAHQCTGSYQLQPPLDQWLLCLVRLMHVWCTHLSVERSLEKEAQSLLVECTANTWASLAEVSHCCPALHELLFPSRCFFFSLGNWASPDESLTGIALLGGMRSAFLGRFQKKNKLWCVMIFQHVSRVTSPCSLQVETSFRALLVSWVQGMQIGLKRISQTVWSHSKWVVLFT